MRRRHDRSHTFRQRQQIVKGIRSLPNLMTQRKGQWRVEEPTSIGGIDVIEAHGVRIGVAEVLLEGCQALVTGSTDAEGFAGE